jgi:tetratricopeptide (TPR) repeat protein
MIATMIIVCVVATGMNPSRTSGQVSMSRSAPPLLYYSALSTFYLGDFRRGLDSFRATARLGLRAGNDRWADSICYHTMAGECYYRLGEIALALNQYNQALRTYLLNRDWLRRVEFPDVVTPSRLQVRRAITWGERPTVMGDFGKMQVLFGDPNAQNALRSGGVFAPPEIRSVDVAEIVRCTALALRRRAEILGPLGATDPLSSQLLVALESRVGRANHWSQAWVEVQRGLALIGMGKEGEGSDALQRSIVIAGQFDHPLTATALFELGRLAELQENYGLAQQNYLQASLAAAEYEQASLAEEALHRLSVVHLLSGGRGVPPQLAPAAAWAKRQRYTQLFNSLLTDTAEHLAAAGDSEKADAAIAQVRQLIGRRQRVSVQVAARLAMQNALVQFQKGRAQGARELLVEALNLQKTCSPWLFQIATVDALYEANSEDLSAREATALYEELLREPTATDWMTNTLDALAVVSSTQRKSFQYWFDITIQRGEDRRAIEIVERLRRHRFFSKLPLAGRALALRWMLEAPEELLPTEIRERRRDLRSRYPSLDGLSQRVATIRDELRAMEIAPDEVDARKSQMELAKKLYAAAAEYEHLLGQIALRREESAYVFPPLLTVEQIQSQLGKKQLVLSFLTTPQSAYAMMLSSTDHAIWKLPSVENAKQGVAAFLREIGMTGDASSLNLNQLEDTQWKSISKSLVDQLIDRPQYGYWKNYEELIVVPDGFLWYLPFEALIVTTAENEEVPLIATMRVRYAPTIALGLPDKRQQKRQPRSAVVLGQLFPRDDADLSREQLTEMQAVVDGLTALPPKTLAPSGIMRSTWDRLLVLDNIDNLRAGILNWAPAGFDQDRPQTSLKRWMALPWGGPSEVYLPGFHTAAENGLRNSATGDEIFFALTGLMAGGTRTVLLSRWRTGGQTSYDLIREYLQELPVAPASEAWQRAVQILRDTEIDPNWEPRINVPADNERLVTADHPFFWSGYILCDRGTTADESAAELQEPDAGTADN